MKRCKEKIKWEIRWNNHPGIHTFSMCQECGKKGHRGETRACNDCLEKELNE